MIIEKIISTETVSALDRIKGELLSNSKEFNSTEIMLDSAKSVFTNQVLQQALIIESTYEELNFLVDEYLCMLSRKWNLSVLITIGFGCQVEAYKRVKRLCNDYFDFSIVVPSREQKPTILFRVSFFKAFEGERYDIDLATRFTN